PDPVGMTASTSRPLSTAATTSSCPGRYASCPKCRRMVARRSTVVSQMRDMSRWGSRNAGTSSPPDDDAIVWREGQDGNFCNVLAFGTELGGGNGKEQNTEERRDEGKRRATGWLDALSSRAPADLRSAA